MSPLGVNLMSTGLYQFHRVWVSVLMFAWNWLSCGVISPMERFRLPPSLRFVAACSLIE